MSFIVFTCNGVLCRAVRFAQPFAMQPALGRRRERAFMALAATMLQLVTSARATDARCLEYGSL